MGQIKSLFYRRDLPHPIYRSSSIKVGVIVRDPQTKWKCLLQSQWKPDEQMEMDIPKVRQSVAFISVPLSQLLIIFFNQIIGLTKLRANFKTPALRKQLLNTCDIFFCDKRILEQMPRILGRQFIETNR